MFTSNAVLSISTAPTITATPSAGKGRSSVLSIAGHAFLHLLLYAYASSPRHCTYSFIQEFLPPISLMTDLPKPTTTVSNSYYTM